MNYDVNRYLGGQNIIALYLYHSVRQLAIDLVTLFLNEIIYITIYKHFVFKLMFQVYCGVGVDEVPKQH